MMKSLLRGAGLFLLLVVFLVAWIVLPWQAFAPYPLNSRVTVTGGTLKATTGGTSAGTVPANPGAVGGTVVDGTVTWQRTA